MIYQNPKQEMNNEIFIKGQSICAGSESVLRQDFYCSVFFDGLNF